MPVSCPTFSFVIPLLNPDSELENCLASLVSQAYVSWEAILVDGGSTNFDYISNLAEIDDRIAVSACGSSGIYPAINFGIQHSRGEWILVLGGDDILFSDYTLLQVSQFLKEGPTLSSIAVYGNALVVGAHWISHGSTYAGQFSLRELLRHNICHQAIFYRGDFARSGEIIYDSTFPVLADWNYNLTAWLKGRFRYVPVTISVYHGGGASSRSYQVDPFFGSKGLRWLYSFCRHNGLSVLQSCSWCFRYLFSGYSEAALRFLYGFL